MANEIGQPIEDSQSVSKAFMTSMVLGVILLMVIVHIGFYKTYLQFFPEFSGFQYVQHFHGAMMMGWMIMLLIQPILIYTGKYQLHRFIGKTSYLLAPLVLISMYLITAFRYESILERSGQTAAVAHLALNVPNILFFGVLYLLAIMYKDRPELHMRYMCSTAFVLVGPGLARVLIGYAAFSLGDAVMVVRILTPLVTGIITILDSLRLKRISPFALVFGMMVLHTIVWTTRETAVWQAIGNVIAQLF